MNLNAIGVCTAAQLNDNAFSAQYLTADAVPSVPLRNAALSLEPRVAAAPTEKEFLWQSLIDGVSFRKKILNSRREFLSQLSVKDFLQNHTFSPCETIDLDAPTNERGVELLNRAIKDFSQPPLNFKMQEGKKYGLLLATTKGWIGSPNPIEQALYDTKKHFEFSFSHSIVVSQACSSTIAALQIANQWLNTNFVDSVIIVSIDLISPFVLDGFFLLRALSQTETKPFHKQRDGLGLGEACVILEVSPVSPELAATSAAPESESRIHIEAPQIICAGHSVTKPNIEENSQFQVLKKVLAFPGPVSEAKSSDALAPKALAPSATATATATATKFNIPEVTIAHGTGTIQNDQAELKAFEELKLETFVTSTKWSLGHCLGASAAIDIAMAAGVLLKQKVFSLPFEKQTLILPEHLQKTPTDKINSILISSLGFGGIHAGVLVKRNSN